MTIPPFPFLPASPEERLRLTQYGELCARMAVEAERLSYSAQSSSEAAAVRDAEFERLRIALRHIEGAALDISVGRATIAKAARSALEGQGMNDVSVAGANWKVLRDELSRLSASVIQGQPLALRYVPGDSFVRVWPDAAIDAARSGGNGDGE